MTLKRPAGIGICPHACPKGRAMISNLNGLPCKNPYRLRADFIFRPKAGAGLSSRNNRNKKGKFIYPNQKRERPAISSNDRGLPYSPPQGGSAICKGQHR